MNRDQTEAHLTLQGWEPAAIAQGAAVRGDDAVYTFFSTGRVHVVKQSLAGLNLRGVNNRATGAWYMSDRLFWALAKYIEELNHADA